MKSTDSKIFAIIPDDMKVALSEAALRAGLTGAAEYLRIAAFYLVEHGSPPPEFAGRRAIMRVGRPRKTDAAQAP